MPDKILNKIFHLLIAHRNKYKLKHRFNINLFIYIKC